MSSRARLQIDRTTLFWGLLCIIVLAVLFSSYVLG
uniref:Photosystem II protein L n=1 Tax=Boodlea composita TaxID=204414 RepID=A0A2H4UXU5_9CHLO|nr:photosystem II protein L [Boodlea composita]